jgi:tungstate transport system substrate-binding protein
MALDTGKRGDADVVFVHAKAQEEKFVAEALGVKRFDVMYNDFVVIGPKATETTLAASTACIVLTALMRFDQPKQTRSDRGSRGSCSELR